MKSVLQLETEIITIPKQSQYSHDGSVAEIRRIDCRTIRETILRLRNEQRKLHQTILSLEKRNPPLQEKALSAYKKNHKRTSNSYITKLLENRKTIKFLFQVELGIERFEMQLEQKMEIGDIDNTPKLKTAYLNLRTMLKDLSEISPASSTLLEKTCDIIESSQCLIGIKKSNNSALCDFKKSR